MISTRWSPKQVKIFAMIVLPIIAVGWLYAGYLIYSYSLLRDEAIKELHAISSVKIVEVVYVPGLPPWHATDCFSIRNEKTLAILSSRLAAADGKGVPDHASLVAKFSLIFETAKAERVRFEGKIFRESPGDVFLRRGVAVDPTAQISEYEGYPARVPTLAEILLDRADENNCPRIPETALE